MVQSSFIFNTKLDLKFQLKKDNVLINSHKRNSYYIIFIFLGKDRNTRTKYKHTK
jgi:hypothetical protein